MEMKLPIVLSASGLPQQLQSGDVIACQQLNSGVLTGLDVTINADTSKFDVAAGTGIVVNWTNPASPTITYVTYAGSTGNTIPNMAAGYTRIYIDSSGALVKSSGGLDTPASRRNYIVLPLLSHPNHTAITNVSPNRKPAYEELEAINDYIKALGVLNTGNAFTANGANLSVNKAAGVFTAPWVNQTVNAQDPCNVVMGALTAVSFATVYRNGSGGNTEGAPTTTVPVTQYDNGTGTLATLSNNYFANHRFYVFANNLVVLAYGQAQYKTSADAVAAIYTENFVAPVGYGQGKAVTVLTVKKSATDLSSSAQAIFTNLQTMGGSSSTVTIPSLQAAFNASPPIPSADIITTATNTSLAVQGGTGSDTDYCFEAKNNAGTTVGGIKANGQVAGSISEMIDSATSKATPVDADEFPIWNSVGGVLGKVTFSNLYNYIKSKLSAAGYIYLATDTYANIVANYDATTYNGCIALVTDVGLTPTVWRAINGEWTHDLFEIIVCRIPSRIHWGGAPGGTATYSQTGTTVTVTTAGAHGLTAGRHNGFEIYLTQSTGSLTSGWFTGFTYISSTSFSVTSTVSQSTSGNLGTRTSQLKTAVSANLPANLIKRGGYVRYDGTCDMINSAGTKTYGFYLGASVAVGGHSFTTFVASRISALSSFLSATSQITPPMATGTSFAVNTSTPAQTAVDTASGSWTVAVTTQLSSSADYACWMGGYIVVRRGV